MCREWRSDCKSWRWEPKEWRREWTTSPVRSPTTGTGWCCWTSAECISPRRKWRLPGKQRKIIRETLMSNETADYRIRFILIFAALKWVKIRIRESWDNCPPPTWTPTLRECCTPAFPREMGILLTRQISGVTYFRQYLMSGRGLYPIMSSRFS